MRLASATVWTGTRKWLGNLVPALFWFPLAAWGLFLIIAKGQFIGSGLYFLIASTVIGWLAVNQFGLFQNSRMRRRLQAILTTKEKAPGAEDVFVGFATPKYSSMLDAHEDVGFLKLLPDRVVFTSESRTLELLKSDVTEIRFRGNVHSVLLLGRWISVEAQSGERPIRMLLEPRMKRTLFGNRLYSKHLLKAIQDWKGAAA